MRKWCRYLPRLSAVLFDLSCRIHALFDGKYDDDDNDDSDDSSDHR